MRLTNGRAMRNSLLAFATAILAPALSAAPGDIPVSPGDPVEVVMAPGACPTFSWATKSSKGIELVVARMDESEKIVYSREMPAGASSWTPAGDHCLAPVSSSVRRTADPSL